jgi:hypothetical protein
MTDLRKSWALTTAHLSRAAAMALDQDLSTFREYLDHNELQLAADVLVELGTEHGNRPRSFWEALGYACDNMGLPKRAVLCRFRIYEAEHGHVEARLTLRATAEGGRKGPIFTDYRPDWNVGNRTETGVMEINGAPVTLEDCASLAPGETGTVRLHPLWRDAWMRVRPGAQIDMHEGAKVVGTATVTRVTLRDGPPPG